MCSHYSREFPCFQTRRVHLPVAYMYMYVPECFALLWKLPFTDKHLLAAPLSAFTFLHHTCFQVHTHREVYTSDLEMMLEREGVAQLTCILKMYIHVRTLRCLYSVMWHQSECGVKSYMYMYVMITWLTTCRCTCWGARSSKFLALQKRKMINVTVCVYVYQHMLLQCVCGGKMCVGQS